MDVGAIHCLSYEDFVSVFGNVVERSPFIPAAVWSQRPFPSVAALQAAIFDFIEALPESGKELRGGTLTRESREEQVAAGLDRMDAAARLNAQYKERFGFPFVMCARTSDKAAIEEQLRERLRNAHAQEISRAVEEVKKICRLRLQGLVLTDQINKL
ncbi:unnamed protein product [Merluccius merluccius]